ncbi:myocardin-like isoform X1 [Acipenser oxyrinchus oxyrinchus]|uniref:Myocardin n=1 Tax=Acipenser oxyrinchus oxyrinchus TaxID=40147 RepID=A0AAD8D486_ACIOX|nr:myocardin-like isoform X1 [Acipenser oxyrinchus oxyrinchus]
MTLLGSEHSLLIRSKFRSVLQLRLQQRRTREQLADHGIMPPLKSPAVFHEQRKSLERSKTEDYLKHKIKSRPEKSDLVNMHILQDCAAEGSLQATQMKLKRARLADDLNEKIALRPGPLELVEKNIIPVDSAVKEAAVKVNHEKFPKQEDSYTFEEDSSSDGLSPEQLRSDESQGSVCSPPETKSPEESPPASAGAAQVSPKREIHGENDLPYNQTNQAESPIMTNNQLTSPIPVPAIVKSKACDKNRHKKPKDTKPKVKKLKYHQYIPPDQKAERSPPPMDSAYARLLQQQQLFLQLQILSQQKRRHHPQQHQQHFNYQPLHQHQHQLKQCNESLPRNTNAPTSTISSSSLSPVKSTFSGQSQISPIKPAPLPSNLDDLKVSELRQQLRIRGLPVSGTKTALMERLRPFQDPNTNMVPTSSDITTVTFPVTPVGSMSGCQSQSTSSSMSNGFYQFGSTSSTPPISPASSDLSVNGSLPDSFSDVQMSSPQFGLQPSPSHLSADEGLMGSMNGGCIQAEMDGLVDAEKDKMLVEKQKMIDELTWKLHQEQRQVEELKMQLHRRKRNHGQQETQMLPHQQQHFFGVSIKQEHVASSCPLLSKQIKNNLPSSCMESLNSCGPPQISSMVSPHCLESAGVSPTMSAFMSPQCSPQHSPLAKSTSLPPSPNNPYLLSVSPSTQAGDSHSHSPQHNGNRQQPVQIPQNGSGQPGNSYSYSTDQRNVQPVFPNVTESSFSRREHSAPNSPKMAILHSPGHSGQKFPISTVAFCSSDLKIKQPPSYEDAVKQQLTRSQQMDELLDVLIESGEMPAHAKEERSCVSKVPRITVSSGSASVPVRKTQGPYKQMSSFEHVTSNRDNHLEALLNSPMSRANEIALLKIETEDPQHEGMADGFSGCHQEELLNTHNMMETPLSPEDARISPSTAEGQGLNLAFNESPWETMEWLDLTPPSSATGFAPLPVTGPSIFNTEFLDVTDLNLNPAMDLHLEQW